ncbi:hypothetical protein DL764_003078 [Monosporascus ibericus]|uniref:Uncharacterized protein n=1 Tax=Monosporascus ibericus TaxID=155417 RepID=A0A4V1XBK6_9PEZI|nr:hypothetical protein DL764_003078 [Monosporascus ibericus]
MATQQQTPKPAKKTKKTLRAALPNRGYEFKDGRSVFESVDDGTVFKAALHKVARNLHRNEVDKVLADLTMKAKEVRKPRATDHSGAFEEARKQTPWASELKEGIISELLLGLVSARALHIKFMRFRPNTVDPRTEGPLAKGIDAFTGEQPAAEPEEHYKMYELDPKLIDNMMERMRKGLVADWDAYSNYNPSDEEMEGAGEEKGGEQKDLGDTLKGLSLN